MERKNEGGNIVYILNKEEYFFLKEDDVLFEEMEAAAVNVARTPEGVDFTFPNEHDVMSKISRRLIIEGGFREY
jgi:hypothetical protein